jgi:hypothetical protein
MPSNEARETAKTLKLAALDFALAPNHTIREELGVSASSIAQRRQTDLYKQAVAEMKEGWLERMRELPGTNEIRKKINYGVGIGVDKLIHILSASKTCNRDIIGATRTLAQMDGRFMGSGSTEAVAPEDEDLRQELVTAVKRHRETLQ